MEYNKIIWLLDPRFDFLLPWFMRAYGVERSDILFVGSYHGAARRGWNTLTLGDVPQEHVAFLEPEDLNRRLSSRLKEGKRTLLIPFTGAYLPNEPWVDCPLTTGKLAIQTNNKWWQYQFFRRAGLPTPETVRLAGEFVQREEFSRCLVRWGKMVVKQEELSGGYRMKVISDLSKWDDYLREQEGSDAKSLLFSEYIPHDQSFAGTGIVTAEGRVLWCGATEQMLYQELYYEGMIFPPFATQSQMQEMERQTRAAGRALAKLGYTGYYNLDFIAGARGIQTVELNARFGFGTLLFACCSGERFWSAAEGREQVQFYAPKGKRLLLGKIKGKAGRVYAGLRGESDILSWFSGGESGFCTFFCGTETPERFDYGSYIGLFGVFCSEDAARDAVTGTFWSHCLSHFLSDHEGET